MKREGTLSEMGSVGRGAYVVRDPLSAGSSPQNSSKVYRGWLSRHRWYAVLDVCMLSGIC